MRNIVPLLEEMVRMDQAITQEEQYELAPNLLKAIAEYAQAENATLYQKKSKSQDYIPIISSGKSDVACFEMPKICLDEYTGILSHFKEKECLILNREDFSKEQMKKEYALLEKENLKTLLFIPILAMKDLCGILKLENVSLPFSEEDKKILQSISGHWAALNMNMRVRVMQEERQTHLEEMLSAEKKYSDIFSALSKIYWQIFSVDLKMNRYIEIFNGLNFDKKVDYQDGMATEEFLFSLEHFVEEDFKEPMREFLNEKTLCERMKHTDTISFEYRAKNGMWLSGRYIAQKRDENGDITNVLFAIRPINDEKQKELKYQKKLEEIAQDAERANMAKTDFLRRMSHDLRTPINGIRGMLEILERNIDNKEKIKDGHRKIWNASEYLLNLVNTVLDMNKLESGELIKDESKFDLRDVLRDFDNVIGTQANEKGICMQVENYEVFHNHLVGSPLYLRQILMNIGNNAVKYTGAGGNIFISCKEKQLSEEVSSYCFSIRDTGIGMSEEFQQYAYDAFTQEHGQIEGGYVGIGLGLAITKELVHFLNGTIDFKSKQKEGTTFIIELPFKIDALRAQADDHKENMDYNLQDKKILVVEDNELNLEITKYILEEVGAMVDEAENGEIAVDKFYSSPVGFYDLILMDIMMPIMDGYQATRAIRQMHRADAKNIPIIAMSANAFQEDMIQSKNAGMNLHLSKPLEMQRLLEGILPYVR